MTKFSTHYALFFFYEKKGVLRENLSDRSCFLSEKLKIFQSKTTSVLKNPLEKLDASNVPKIPPRRCAFSLPQSIRFYFVFIVIFINKSLRYTLKINYLCINKITSFIALNNG